MRRSSVFLAVVALVSGCGLSRPAASPSSSLATTDAVAGLTDANIVAIVIAANHADILYADLALAKSVDPDVRAFASMVRQDHQAVNEAVVALVTRLSVTPVENESSLDLRDDADATRLALRDLEGFAFDSAYGASEVAYHRLLLRVIEGTLLPGAKNSDLRALLLQVRPAVAAHLSHALALAERLSARRPWGTGGHGMR